MRKNKNDFFVPGGKKFLNGDKPDQDTFEDLTDSVTFPTELTDRAKVSESGLTKTTTDLKVNTGDDTDQSGISPLGFPVIVKPSQLWRLSTSDPQVVLTAVTRVPGSPVDSEDGSLIEDIEISLNITPPAAAVTGADNGLTLVGNNVELGGTLTKNTTILGASFDLTLSGLNITQISSDTLFFTGATFSALEGPARVRIATALTTGLLEISTPLVGVASVGYVLTLLNTTTGACEWEALPAASTNIYSADGDLAGNRIVRGLSTFSLTFTDITNFIVSNANDISLTSTVTASINTSTLTLDVTGAFLLKSPAINGLGPAPIAGDVLTLINSVTGESEWQTATTGTDTNLATNDQFLLGDRTIDGSGTWICDFDNLSFVGTQNNTGVINISWRGPGITTIGGAELRLEEGGMVGKSIGDVLVLKNASTGACEWENERYVQDILFPSWVAGAGPATPSEYAVQIFASSHNKGTNPIVQVYIDLVGSFTTMRQLYPFPSGDLAFVEVDSFGNMWIGTANSTINLRVIIS